MDRLCCNSFLAVLPLPLAKQNAQFVALNPAAWKVTKVSSWYLAQASPEEATSRSMIVFRAIPLIRGTAPTPLRLTKGTIALIRLTGSRWYTFKPCFLRAKAHKLTVPAVGILSRTPFCLHRYNDHNICVMKFNWKI
jgi:hypothetical protein